jgi:hypothetical protein
MLHDESLSRLQGGGFEWINHLNRILKMPKNIWARSRTEPLVANDISSYNYATTNNVRFRKDRRNGLRTGNRSNISN